MLLISYPLTKNYFALLNLLFAFILLMIMKKKGEENFFFFDVKRKKKFLKGRREVKRIRTESEFSLAGNVCCLKDKK